MPPDLRPPLSHEHVWMPLTEEFSDELDNNPTGLQLTFLGTASDHSPTRYKFCLGLRTFGRSSLLFECPEDVQRQLMTDIQAQKASRIDHIFISSLKGDNILGIPGMLCQISGVKGKTDTRADMPVHIYGPKGLSKIISDTLKISDTYLAMPVIVHEFTLDGPEDLAAWPDNEVAEWEPQVQLLNPRARLFCCFVPPDQKNPRGSLDATVSPLITWGTRKQVRKRQMDGRNSNLPLPLPPPGDPAAEVKVAEVTWTLHAQGEFMVTAAPVPCNGVPCLAFTYVEADKAGMLNVKKATEAGVPNKFFAQLKKGEDYVDEDTGHVVRSLDVVNPTIPGRSVIVVPETSIPRAPNYVAERAAPPLLVAAGTFQGTSVADKVGQLAEKLGCSQVLMTRCGEDVFWSTKAHEVASSVDEWIMQCCGDVREHTSADVIPATDLRVMNVPRLVERTQDSIDEKAERRKERKLRRQEYLNKRKRRRSNRR